MGRAAMNAPSDPTAEFLHLLGTAVGDGSFVKLTLGAPRGSDETLRNLLVRPVELKAGPRLAFVWRHKTRDITKNLTHDDGLAVLATTLGTEFGTAHLFTTKCSAQLEVPLGKPARLVRGAPRHDQPPDLAHDRTKARPLELARRPWLHPLGLATADGTLRASAAGKVQQIERFLELLAHHTSALRAEAAGRTLEIVDLGSGKAYLTFAIADWLRELGIPARIQGIEARSDLVALCSQVAREHGYDELRFVAGTIADFTWPALDVLVALHACDTATDEALAKGIAARARVILAAPCCHREVRAGFAPNPELAAVHRHGILRERDAEIATDALRAALLEWSGYDTKVFEFVAGEHTQKNLMIAAVRRSDTVERTSQELALRAVARHYGVRTQHLAQLLGFAF